MSRYLPFAQYYYALGENGKALEYAKEGLRHLNSLVEAGQVANPRDRMSAALAIYDQIKKQIPLSKDQAIELLTSKFGKNIVLPAWAWQLDGASLAEFAEPFTDEMESWPSDEVSLSWSDSEFAAVAVDNDEIVQSSLGDCSVVASLIAINAMKTNPMLQRIYPQQNGQAVLSPTGHYFVKLMVSGTERIVEISDRRPISSSDTPAEAPARPLHLTTKYGSAWPFLCEKAYMKMMGGYAFPGSHAAIDTYRMTGWLPEYVDLTAWSAANPGKTLADLFGRWESQWRSGTAILCLGTNSDAAPPLAPSHDYAIVAIAEGRAKVVNPWLSSTENRWYSSDEIFQLFGMLYLNTDPSNWSFKSRAFLMTSVSGIQDMSYNLGAHPQYTVYNPGKEKTAVYVYASVKPGPGRRQGYLNVQAYLCDNRVYSAQIVELVSRSVESSALYTSMRLNLPPKTSVTCVLHTSQLELGADSAVFSIEFLSDAKIETYKPKKLPCETRLVDRWSADAACSFSDPALGDNPQFYIDVETPSKRLDVHYIPYSNSLGAVYSQLAVFYGDKALTTTIPAPDVTQTIAYNSVYNRGGTSTKLTQVSPGRYVVIPALSEPADGQFAILATCDTPVKIGKLLPLHSGLFERQYKCFGSDVELRFAAPETCDISFQIDSEIEARLCVYDETCRPLAITNNSEFKRGRLHLTVNAASGFCKVEGRRGVELTLQAFATFPIELRPA